MSNHAYDGIPLPLDFQAHGHLAGVFGTPSLCNGQLADKWNGCWCQLLTTALVSSQATQRPSSAAKAPANTAQAHRNPSQKVESLLPAINHSRQLKSSSHQQ